MSINLHLRSVPFNVRLLSNDPSILEGIPQVTSMSIMDGYSAEYDPKGLYSSEIFGDPGSDDRMNKMGWINLRVPVFQPYYYLELVKIKALYGDIINSNGFAVWDEKEKDFVRSDALEGETGMSFFCKHFADIEFKSTGTKSRDERIKRLVQYRPLALTSFIVVMPAGLRDVTLEDGKRPEEAEINPLLKRCIAISNTVSEVMQDKNSPMLDGPRRSMQKALVEIYKYVFSVLEGKRGFMAAKVGSRRVIDSTRNVLTSMETDSEILGDSRQPNYNTVHVSLLQAMKASQMMLTEYYIENDSLASDFIRQLDGTPSLINPKTLKLEPTELKASTIDLWGTKKGLVELINTFESLEIRHKPVMVEGKYLALVYDDEKDVKFFHDIDTVPEKIGRKWIRPVTWNDFWYHLMAPLIPKSRALVTRYPVIELGSILPLVPYLKTTTKANKVHILDDNWELTEETYLEFPDWHNRVPSFNTMSVHPATLTGFGADGYGAYF